MDISAWEKRKEEIEKQTGGWISYSFIKKEDGFILGRASKDNLRTDPLFFERVLSCAQDLSKKPLSECSVIDLACLEGIASLMFAKQGAKKVLGIDGRMGNGMKAEFAKETLDLDNVDFRIGDMRELDFGNEKFDILLALGIVYHLDAPDVFKFVENIYKWTNGIAIIDTHFALVPKYTNKYGDKIYSGIYYNEFIPEETYESSIGNERSFWLTKDSLFNLLVDVGFKSIYECKYPRAGGREFDDRITLVVSKESRDYAKVFLKEELESSRFGERDPLILCVDEGNFVKR